MHEADLKHIYDVSLFNIDDFDILLHKILKQTRSLLNAEAGTVYIKEGDYLTFNVFQNDALSYESIYNYYNMLQDIKLPITNDNTYLAVESFVSHKIIVIDDVYDNNQYDFVGVKEFDQRFSYATKSLITVPLIHPMENSVLGVIQLLNKKEDGNYVCFDDKDKTLLSMVSSFIAISISKAQTDVEKLEKLNNKLQEANHYLEQRIQLEMDENEKKNAIIFHQSKLISMGEMVGNIAHQWRQPLSTISTIASGLSINLEMNNLDEKDAVKQLRHVVDTTQHLSRTIDDFRNFYKVDKMESHFKIEKTIKKCLSILDASISTNHITVVLNCNEYLELFGLENEFMQAILNIISNAKDALVESVDRNKERFIFIDLNLEQDFIVLRIKDNANGIDEDIMLKIFEQNFTTKEESGGTGIGLFMTEQIVHKHMNASIAVYNSEYEYKDTTYTGAEFVLIFKP